MRTQVESKGKTADRPSVRIGDPIRDEGLYEPVKSLVADWGTSRVGRAEVKAKPERRRDFE